MRHCAFPSIIFPQEEAFQTDIFERHHGCGGNLCDRIHISALAGFHDAIAAQGGEIFVSSLSKYMHIGVNRAFKSNGRSFFVEESFQKVESFLS